MGVVGLLLGAFIAAGTSVVHHSWKLAVASAAVFLFIAAGNSLNDYIDREVDRRAHPNRPIPSGRVRAENAFILSGFMFSLAVGLSLFLDWISLTIVVVALVAMLLYEFNFKRRALSGNLMIAGLTGALFLLGGAVVGVPERTVIIAAMAFLATLGREVVKDMEDMESDFDRRTLPQAIGRRRAGVIGSLAFLLAVALSVEPYLSGYLGVGYMATVAIADGIFIYSSLILFRSPRKGQNWAKVGMLIALLAFLLGGLT